MLNKRLWILSFHWCPMVFCRWSFLAWLPQPLNVKQLYESSFSHLQKCLKWGISAWSEIPIYFLVTFLNLIRRNNSPVYSVLYDSALPSGRIIIDMQIHMKLESKLSVKNHPFLETTASKVWPQKGMLRFSQQWPTEKFTLQKLSPKCPKKTAARVG